MDIIKKFIKENNLIDIVIKGNGMEITAESTLPYIIYKASELHLFSEFFDLKIKQEEIKSIYLQENEVVTITLKNKNEIFLKST